MKYNEKNIPIEGIDISDNIEADSNNEEMNKSETLSITIPWQLQNDNFKFIKTNGKKPIESDWTSTANYSFDDKEFLEYLNDADSYGVTTGFGFLVVLDIDEPGIYDEIREKIPDTFTVRSGNGGYHCYFMIKDWDEKIILEKDDIHYGEVQFKGQMVIGPGSLHENGNRYQVVVDAEIAVYTKEELMNVIKPYIDITGAGPTKQRRWMIHSNPCKYDITKVIELSHFKLIKTTGEYQGANPIIGSNTGTNLNVDPKSNLWMDWRNEVGGDAIDWIALRHELIAYTSYVQMRKQGKSLNGEIYTKACEIGRDLYKLDIPMRKPLVYIYDEQKQKQVRNIRGIAKYIVNKHKCITVNDNTGSKPYIYVYRDGYYLYDYFGAIENEIKEILGNSWNLTFKNEITSYIQTEHVLNREDMLPQPNLINLNNGVYNIETYELLPHSPDYHFLYKIPWNYNPNATCPSILQYFNTTLEPEFIQLSQEIFGYCLYFDYPIAALFYLYGTGGNGKSVWIHLLQTLLGEMNFASQEIGSLAKNRFSTASLYGKLANICGELTSKDLNETDLIKRLSSGDYIQAEFKGKNPFNFRNRAKLITACNTIPYCSDRTDGWEQRQYVIPFLKKFRDTDNDKVGLKDELIKQKSETEGLLLWSLIGLKRVIENKRFSYPKNRIETYYNCRDNLSKFISNHIEKTGEFHDYETMDNIYSKYREWCQYNNLPSDSKNALSRKLTYMKITTDRIEDGDKLVRIRRYCKLVHEKIEDELDP